MNCLKDENVDWYRWIDKRVCAKGTLCGTLKYFGTTKFSDGLWCGIELDEPVGKNDGSVNNVKYFTCLSKCGIFVPVSKVCKVENDPKNLNGTFMHLNKTFDVQNFPNNTILVSNSDDKSHCNKGNEEICKVKKNKTLDIRHDSEESLGLLDPNLIESLTTSWDSFTLDTATGDIVPDFQESGFTGPNLITSNSLFSNEIINPKYASTPRHPIKKRFSDFGMMDLALQNVNEHNDVFENEMNFAQDIFFDSEKFKNSPNLTSTCEFFPIPITSSGTNKNILSPVQSNPTAQIFDLNKAQILPPFITNHEIRPVSMDLNKTQTIQNRYRASVSNADVLSTTFKIPTEIDSTENLNLAVNLQISEGSENYQKSCEVDTPADTVSETDNTETKDMNRTICLQINERAEKYKKSCQVISRTEMTLCENIDLSTTENLNLAVSLQISEGSENYQKSCRVDTLADTVSETDNTETKDLNKTISLQINERAEKFQKSCQVGSRTEKTLCENIDLSTTCDLGLKSGNAAFKELVVVNNNSESDFNQHETANSCLSKTFNNDLSSPLINGQNKDNSLFQKTFVLDSSLSGEEQNSKQAISNDVLSDNAVQLESFDFKGKYLEETTISENALSDVNARKSICVPGKSHNTLNYSQKLPNSLVLNSTFNIIQHKKSNVSISSKNQKSVSSMQLKTNSADKKVVDFKKPLSMYSSTLKSNALLKEFSSTGSKEKSSHSKESLSVQLKKPLVSKVNLKSSASSVDIKLEQGKENRRINSIENESSLPGTSLVSNMNSKTGVSSGVKYKKGRLSASFDLEDKFNKEGKSAIKSRYSRRFSYSQSAQTTELSNTTGILSLQSKDNKSSNKIKFPVFAKALPTNDLNACSTSKVPLNSVKNAAFVKKTFNKSSNNIVENSLVSQIKEPAANNKMPISQQSFVVSSTGCGSSRRNSLATSSKANLPVGIIKPRFSMLPLIAERNLLKANDTVHIVEQPTKSSDKLVPEAVPIVSSCTVANSSKTSRIASSLPVKSQLSLRKMGQKYSDVREKSGACLKIPRYSLRGKK